MLRIFDAENHRIGLFGEGLKPKRVKLFGEALGVSFTTSRFPRALKEGVTCLSLVGLSASGFVLALWLLFVVLNVLSGGLTCLSFLGLSASLVQVLLPNRKVLTKT